MPTTGEGCGAWGWPNVTAWWPGRPDQSYVVHGEGQKLPDGVKEDQASLRQGTEQPFKAHSVYGKAVCRGRGQKAIRPAPCRRGKQTLGRCDLRASFRLGV